MKKWVVLLLACIVCVSTFAQESVYISASGNSRNSGLSEEEPVGSFFSALLVAGGRSINRITVIGTLDVNSERSAAARREVFRLFSLSSDELLITGKPNASEAERAVLSAKGSGKNTVLITSGRIRFEHIDIADGEGNGEGDGVGNGIGLHFFEGTQVTLGPGAVVRNNPGAGIFFAEATCIIDGGEVSNNSPNLGILVVENGELILRNGTISSNMSISRRPGAGVMIGNGGRFTMSGGTITRNLATAGGGGVFVDSGGQFTMLGGNIMDNVGTYYRGMEQLGGGGVVVANGGRFDQTGGSVHSNNRESLIRLPHPDIVREQGALGSNLPPNR
ncbi:MAG: right-handed parallel beta-helix repeat-containing protein [Treponema sp.]|nr:right-handed parallel beta-helix repeat-containing protein [Treponema sp.]